MPDYCVSKIYKITSPYTSFVYFGCTVCNLYTKKENYKQE